MAVISTNGCSAVRVWVDAARALDLQRELERACVEAAERRREEAAAVATDADAPARRRHRTVDRVTRAKVLVAWSRYGGRTGLYAVGIGGLLGWHLLDTGTTTDQAVRVLGFGGVLAAIRHLLVRWYRRSDPGA